MAHPGSMHGYDVTDHTRFNPEIGSAEEFAAFAERLKQQSMGLVVDVVPNHMCITHPSNLWWWDVLENGPGSDYSSSFDIDWDPPKAELANKVLLPSWPTSLDMCWKVRQSEPFTMLDLLAWILKVRSILSLRVHGHCFWIKCWQSERATPDL